MTTPTNLYETVKAIPAGDLKIQRAEMAKYLETTEHCIAKATERLTDTLGKQLNTTKEEYEMMITKGKEKAHVLTQIIKLIDGRMTELGIDY